MKKETFIREQIAAYQVPEKEKIPLHPPLVKGEYKGDLEEVHYMSEEEFLEKAPDNKVWELHHGELIIHSPVGYVHKSLDSFIFNIMFNYINAKGLGAVFNSPAAIKFDRDVLYEPDVFFVKKDNKGKIGKYLFIGVPDLIVEVVSPGHGLYDKRTKFVNYEKYGVQEYWILDPHNKKYNFYRNIKGKFVEASLEAKKSSTTCHSEHSEESPSYKSKVIPITSPSFLKRGEGRLYRSKVIPGFYLRLDWLINEKYWRERNVSKIIYELIGKKAVIEDIGEKEAIEIIGEEKIIDTIGEERLLEIIRRRK